ncbi:high mobility group b protein 10 [Phtheirospermum japonicum]|uniref:High mobility group b protein 10 n=1 Tax=Phtheirospermum japonicum TaxID=374723 RepID=A0A830CVS9_9LAMI|nr:high mobility group b protein 10 [Phtheirospermum japonicum]
MSNDPPLEKPISKYFSNYPKPEAEYQEIIQNPEVFLQKLQDFHVFYGTKFRIPTLGGNNLDLHRLFLEVTSRGGIEKVIKDRRWKEITAVFNFPSTITSASFVLRRYYLSLLYHFEQVYYFRKEEPTDPSSATRSANESPLPDDVDDGAASNQLKESLNLEDGSLVTGTIEGKFDFGYMVTVNFGGENLKGVLYHTPEAPNASSVGLNGSGEPTHHRTRRKHQLAFRDPAHPKRNRSGYTFFFAEQYHRLRPLYYGQERTISKKIGHLWSRLTEAEKQVYQEKGLRDKERYKAEMSEYKTSHHAPA